MPLHCAAHLFTVLFNFAQHAPLFSSAIVPPACSQENRQRGPQWRTITQSRPATLIARPEAGKDTSVTIPSAPDRPQQSLLPWGLTAGAVVAGPSLLSAAQAAPAVTLVSVAIGLTALVIAVALRRHTLSVAVGAPALRRIRPPAWPTP